MADDIITISAGAGAPDIAPGVYDVTLGAVSGVRTIYPQSGPNAGGEVQIRDWTFVLEDGTEVSGSASTASGPRSKTYAWVTALLGGQAPAPGAVVRLADLVGRGAIATIAAEPGGWPRITTLSARPQRRQAAAPPAPAARPAAPAGDDPLPF